MFSSDFCVVFQNPFVQLFVLVICLGSMNSLSKRQKEESERKRKEEEAIERAKARREKRNELARRRRARNNYWCEFVARKEAEARGEIYVKKETRGRKRKYPIPPLPEAASTSRSKSRSTRLDMNTKLKPTPPSKLAGCNPGIQAKLFDSGKPDVSCTIRRPKIECTEELKIGPKVDPLTFDRHCTKCNAICKKLVSSKHAGIQCGSCRHQLEFTDQSDGNFQRCIRCWIFIRCISFCSYSFTLLAGFCFELLNMT